MMRKIRFSPLGLLLLLGWLVACGPLPPPGFSAAEAATLNSLEQLDAYPLYVMHYQGAYPAQVSQPWPRSVLAARQLTWGCSLFAALGDGGDRLAGRNFDWRFSPALLLFTEPPGAFASVSLVDLEYLGFDGEPAKKLLDLPLEARRSLLDAPTLPFDGLNEKGLAVGMAAVPEGQMQPDPQKAEIGQLRVIREILDHAATVDEALQILGSYNIDMSEVPIHYLISSVSGEAALVEFYQGQMVVTRNAQPWHLATNFLVAGTQGQPAGSCSRYDRLAETLTQTQGQLTQAEALDLLAAVSQPNTQWSAVYNLTRLEVQIVMGRNYAGQVHTLSLGQP